MGSIPPTSPKTQEQQIAQLKNTIAKLQAENERIKSAYNLLRTENHQLLSQLDWQKRLFSNPAYSFSEKCTILASKPLLLASTPNEQGLSHIPLYKVAQALGTSPKTVGRNFSKLSETTVDIQRDADRNENEEGKWKTDVYIAFSEQLLTRPDMTTRFLPRNQGGKRVKRCKDCGSENLVEQKTITCAKCGSEQSRTLRPVNHPEGQVVQEDEKPAPPTAQETSEGQLVQEDGVLDHSHEPNPHIPHDITLLDPPMNNLSFDKLLLPPQKPATPPEESFEAPLQSPQEPLLPPKDNLSNVLKPEKPKDNLSLGEEKPTTPPTQEEYELLLDIAGDTLNHIVMNTNPEIEKKYLTVHRPLTLEDVQMHLAGTKTIGASLAHRDETTRSLCFDADTTQDWQKLQDAARLLQMAGYYPLLEPSPVRGGHLWVIFSERVNATAAHTQVCTIAPTLREINEYWPRGNGAKVRLPRGKYVTPTFLAWCHLYDANGSEISKMLLTPAYLIPDAPPLPPLGQSVVETEQETHHERTGTAGVDDYHRQKYQDAHFWFAWTPTQLAEWYQERTTIAELLPPERNGNGLASWRGERTASVAYTKDGEGWIDFGASARQPDGKQDGGDCLELLARMQQRSKSEVMSDLGKILVREAKEALISAAESLEQPPAWVQKFMTDEGWKYYHRLVLAKRAQHGKSNVCSDQVGHDEDHADEEEQQDGGVAGFGEEGGHDEVKEVSEDHSPRGTQEVYWWQKEEPLAEEIPEHFFTADPPCEQCGCALQRDMLGSIVCVRCYPPRGYHLYQHLIDAQYPRGKCSGEPTCQKNSASSPTTKSESSTVSPLALQEPTLFSAAPEQELEKELHPAERLAKQLKSYQVLYLPNAPCTCGCELWRPVLGTYECC